MIAPGRFLGSFRAAPILVAAAALAGCDSAAPYRAAVRDQTKAWEQLAAILGTVTDQASMKSARTKLQLRFEDVEAITRRAQKLPPPTPEMTEQVQEEGVKLRQALQLVLEQVGRISAMPGGREFLLSFEQMKGFLEGPLP